MTIGLALSIGVHVLFFLVSRMLTEGEAEKTVKITIGYDLPKPPVRFDPQPPRFVKSFAFSKEVSYAAATAAREIQLTRSEAPRTAGPSSSSKTNANAGRPSEGSVFFGALTASGGTSELGWGIPGGATSYGRSFGVGGSGGYGAGPGDGKEWGPQFAADVENTRGSGAASLSSMRENLLASENFQDRFDGFIEVNPKNKKDVKGFLNVYQLQYNSARLEKSPTTGWDVVDNQPSWNCVPQALPSLAQYANESTKLRVQIRGTIRLDSKELNTVPFLFMMGFQAPIKYTKEEARSLARYLRNGGFLFIDDGCAYQPGAFNQTIRQMLKEGLGYDAIFEKVPNSHPLYTSWENFNGPPSGEDLVRYNKLVREIKEIYPYVEAIFLNGRMAVLISNRGYSFAWGYWKFLPSSSGGPYDNQRQLQFGLNVVVYALTQRGGIADQNRSKIAAEQKR